MTFACIGNIAAANERLCDSSFTDCRAQLYTLIDHEQVEIDAAFWFMKDQSIATHIVNRWKAGVRVRLLVDPRANDPYPANATALSTFKNAGIPMRYKVDGGILHAKVMLFAGQNVVEFGSANYSQSAWVPATPYTNYEAETIFFSDDPDLVNSYETKIDDLWTDTTAYADYANIQPPLVRAYATYPISPDLDFPPGEDFADRTAAQLNNEAQQIDVIMYRIDDRRFSDAMIGAWQRGIPVRYIGETSEYRKTDDIWIAWNMDRMYAAGIPMRVRESSGLNHEKLVLLYGSGVSIFGSANWAVDSANSQQEDNYFTSKNWIFQWFANQFTRKWTNAKASETKKFSPLAPDVPKIVSPADDAVGIDSAPSLTWYGGPWAHSYDIYFGTDPNPPLFAADQPLGPSLNATQDQSVALPPLSSGTTYYWKIVARTAANRTATSPVWSFTTATDPSSPPPDPQPQPSTPPPPPPSGTGTIVLWASKVDPANVHGRWQFLADSNAAGGAVLWNPDAAQAKVSAQASPANFWQTTFTAAAGTYHLWVRLRAQNNATANDSVSVQFDDAIGTTSGASVILQNGSSGAAPQGFGWADNGWGVPGANISLSTTGAHTIRIQQREDGAMVDQIVLSADTYLSAPPGPRTNDATILPFNDGADDAAPQPPDDPPPSTDPPPPPPPSGTIVLAAANVAAANVHGNWQLLSDATATNGVALWNPDAGQAKVSASAMPANYWELTFNAPAGVAYHLWIRLRAQNNSFGNDSVTVQFDDAIGTTKAASVILQNGSNGAADHGWGWADNGWDAPGASISFATDGPHTIRVQQREDGAIVDQIVLSPDTYFTTPPGPRQNDTTLLPPTQ
ncbi:MAG TPA: phospholipase D-like domain-containing protein [Vicinamibacterales bacterium]|nr:phospholipase D-like domain-containing protein [Vicinamibacterales bacterium]